MARRTKTMQAARQIAELHAANHQRLFYALCDLLGFFDRRETSNWTWPEVKRLREIRETVGIPAPQGRV